MLLIISFIFIFYIIYILYQHFYPTPNISPKDKYIFISGCDTGFGHGLAIKLDKQGFNVLAGVFDSDNVTSLREKLTSRATVFRLDITKQEDIEAAFELVTQKTQVLHALVNNAGIVTSGYIDWIQVDTVRQLMNVNFFGHVTMTKRFLPLLIAKRDSRVVNVSSICGFISLPGSAAYCASKYALESFCDCLRREMRPWGLRVSIIEPGTMQTAMTERLEQSLKNVWLQLPNDTRKRWGEQFFDKSFQLVINSAFIRYSEDPEKVIRVLEHAAISTTPYIRYRPGWQSSLFFYPLSILPCWLVDKMFSLGFNACPDGVKHQLLSE
ncbi:unnamed protein product [Rotaria socialis]|uniref:Uncharacterized protein n=1 Tax=Rotaria socialis TaxID=392032 RepID=A0A817T787_9BILA|nr:unnamed protein product [Rotaria socialis]CAF3309336.1 unnamed protein product [Rotaria socialis]CAF3365200.1 unnamed protein product [Rotaria socialis]CAF3700127.1 unnamed protein product [Rotaria socialis]CAF4479960.1 unnamed protein product [Rotaria socialis]